MARAVNGGARRRDARLALRAQLQVDRVLRRRAFVRELGLDLRDGDRPSRGAAASSEDEDLPQEVACTFTPARSPVTTVLHNKDTWAVEIEPSPPSSRG